MGTRAPRTDEVHPMLPCTSPVCQWLFLTRGFILGNQQSGTIWNCIKFACACRKVLFMKHSTVCPDGYWNTSSLVVIKVTEIGNRTWEQSWCGNGWPLATLCIPTWAAGPGQCLHISLGQSKEVVALLSGAETPDLGHERYAGSGAMLLLAAKITQELGTKWPPI